MDWGGDAPARRGRWPVASAAAHALALLMAAWPHRGLMGARRKSRARKQGPPSPIRTVTVGPGISPGPPLVRGGSGLSPPVGNYTLPRRWAASEYRAGSWFSRSQPQPPVPHRTRHPRRASGADTHWPGHPSQSRQICCGDSPARSLLPSSRSRTPISIPWGVVTRTWAASRRSIRSMSG